MMRKFLSFLVVFLAALSTSFLLPGYYDIPYPKPLGPELSPLARQSYRIQMEQDRPDVVLLGDSMLYLGIDEIALADRLDRSVYKIAIPGSTSAAWYLITRHNIAVAEPPPGMLVIFFRDAILTAPGYRVHGSYYENVVYENTAPDDSLFIQYSFIDQMNPAQKFFEQYLPLYGQRLDVRAAIDNRLSYSLPDWITHCDVECTDLAMSDVFNANNLDTGTLSDAVATTERYLYTPENLDFSARIDHSYLPEIIRMSKDAGIRLVLVRCKTLYTPPITLQQAGLREYIEDLGNYLIAQDVPLLDYSADPRLTAEHYLDPFHLNLAGQKVFTGMLSEDLNSLLDLLP